MSKVLGRVYGENIDSSFTFVSKEFIESSFVRINKYAEGNAYAIGKIMRRSVHNPYCVTPETIRYINDDYSFKNDTLYTYSVICIGTIKNERLVREFVPAIPGSEVYDVDPKDLMNVYGIPDGGIVIGCLSEAPECTVSIDINTLINPHLFIVGKTGSGKSYFIKKILDKTDANFWVFSPSDEYNMLSQKDGYKEVKKIEIPWDINQISYFLELNASEENLLNHIEIKTGVNSIEQITDRIKEHCSKSKDNFPGQVALDLSGLDMGLMELPRFANTLIKKLKSINKIAFNNRASIKDLLDGAIIFNFEDYNQLEQECIINSLLFRLRKHLMSQKSNVSKHLIIVEEAHNYMPSERNTKCKNELVKLAREGRKYGASLCFVTQRPRFFDQTALAQSGNKVVFSLSNPEDIKHVMDDACYYDSSLLRDIPQQRQGECVIVGDAYNDIVKTKIFE